MLFNHLSQRLQNFGHNSIIGQIVLKGLDRLEQRIESRIASEDIAAEVNNVVQDVKSAMQEEPANIPTAETIEPYSESGLNALASYSRGGNLFSGLRNLLNNTNNRTSGSSRQTSWAEGGRAELTDEEKNNLWEQVSAFCQGQNYNPVETQIVYRTQLDSMSRQKKKNMEQSQATAARKAAEQSDANARQAKYFPHYQWYVMEMFLAKNENGEYILGNAKNKDTMNYGSTYGFIDFDILGSYCSYNSGSGYTYTPNYNKTDSVYDSGGRVFVGQNVRASFDDYFTEKFKDYQTTYDTPTYTEEEYEKVKIEALDRLENLEKHMYWCDISTICVALGLSEYFSADNSTFEYTTIKDGQPKTYKFSRYTCYAGATT